jgi:hypothetical protein
MTAMTRAIGGRQRVLLVLALVMTLAATGCASPHGPYSSHGADTMRTFSATPGLGGGGG